MSFLFLNFLFYSLWWEEQAEQNWKEKQNPSNSPCGSSSGTHRFEFIYMVRKGRHGVQQREVFSFMHSKANPKDQMCAQTTVCQCDEDWAEVAQCPGILHTCRKKQMPTLNLPPDFTLLIGLMTFKTNLRLRVILLGLWSLFSNSSRQETLPNWLHHC